MVHEPRSSPRVDPLDGSDAAAPFGGSGSKVVLVPGSPIGSPIAQDGLSVAVPEFIVLQVARGLEAPNRDPINFRPINSAIWVAGTVAVVLHRHGDDPKVT